MWNHKFEALLNGNYRDLFELVHNMNSDFCSATAGLKGVKLLEAHLDWPRVDFDYIPVSASPDVR
jgi:hypothetical protein